LPLEIADNNSGACRSYMVGAFFDVPFWSFPSFFVEMMINLSE